MSDITASGLKKDIDNVLSNGERTYFRYFTGSITTGSFDDLIILYKSGNDIQTSGLHFNLSSRDGSSDRVLVEQGLLLNDDLKLYVLGHIETSGLFRIGLGGSPPTRWYGVINEATHTWNLLDTNIYKKLFLRFLPIGSLIGE